MKRITGAALVIVAILWPGLPHSQTYQVGGGGLLQNASNATLPDAVDNLGLGAPLAATVTCTTTNGSAVVASCNSTAGAAVGMVVSGPGIVAGTTIASGITATGFTMSANAGAAAGTGLVTIRRQPFWSDVDGGTPSIIRVSGRMMVGGAVGTLAARVGTHFNFCPYDSTCASWAARDADFAVMSSRGSMAIVGMSRASDASNTSPATSTIGGAFFAVHDGAAGTAAVPGWAIYGDVQHDSTVAGVKTWVAELVAKNKSGINSTSFPYSEGNGPTGIALRAGADGGSGGQPNAPANTGIWVGVGTGNAGNYTNYSWNKGIVFDARALTGTDGVTGTGVAMEMARGHVVSWRGPANIAGADMYSLVATSGKNVALAFLDDTIGLYGTGGAGIANFSHVASAVNRSDFSNAATGVAPKWSCAGTDANIDCQIVPKGTGIVKTPGHLVAGGATDCGTTLCSVGGLNLGSGSYLGFNGSTTTDTSNYHLYGDATYAILNGPGGILARINNATIFQVTSGGVLMSGGTVTGLAAPSGASDAVTKAYADSIASGIVTHASAAAASTVNLTPVTLSGTGVGKTITNAGTQAAFAIDGYSAAVNDRILIKNQTTQKDNGIYTVTTVGTGATNWVLTRATDFDAASASEVAVGASVIVVNGTAGARTQWIETGQGAFTVDTTAIVFSQTVGASNGTVNSGTAKQLGYYAGTGTAISGLSTGNNGLLVTDGSGNPSISSTIPTATQANITQTGTIATGVWHGTAVDLNYGGTNANLSATGGAGQVLKQTSVGGAVSVATLNYTELAGTLAGATGLPIGTGVSGLGIGVAAFLATPTSANLAAAVTDEQGTGALVFASDAAMTSPTLTDPIMPGYKVNSAVLTAATTTTFATVPGLTCALTAGKTYVIQGHLTISPAAPAAGGVKMTLANADTLTITSGSFTGQTYTGATNNARTTATALGTTVGAATAAATVVDFNGALVVNAGGSVAVQAAQNVASGTTTVGINSWVSCTRVN